MSTKVPPQFLICFPGKMDGRHEWKIYPLLKHILYLAMNTESGTALVQLTIHASDRSRSFRDVSKTTWYFFLVPGYDITIFSLSICLSFMKACMNSSWKLTSSNPFCSKIIYLVIQLFFIFFSPDTHSKEFKWLELTVLTSFNICQLLETRKFVLQRALILLLWCCKRRGKFCLTHVSPWNLDLIRDVQNILRLKANIWDI